VIEALAAGLPVVATSTGGIREQLEAGGGILVPQGDAVELAVAIERVLRDGELHAALAAEARGRRPSLDVARQIDAYEELYGTVVNAGARR
jgi:glycosyltransferase involved in cell wall biosynthesis